MTNEQSRLNDARKILADLDARVKSGPLYVGAGDNPVEALRKIYDFLVARAMDADMALAAANLERVLDRLSFTRKDAR